MVDAIRAIGRGPRLWRARPSCYSLTVPRRFPPGRPPLEIRGLLLDMILLALLVLSIPICAIAGLVLALSARGRLDALHQRIAALEGQLARVRRALGPSLQG